MIVAGLLLAGGRSTRFGTDKSVFPLADGLMMDRPLRALRAVCAMTAVSARPDGGAAAHAADLGLTCLHDRPGDPEGPLAGLRAGMDWAQTQGAAWLATAPCDGPTIDAARIRGLVAAVAAGAPAAVARSSFGLEPLLAVWPVDEGLRRVAAALDAGAHPPVRRLLDDLGARAVDGYDGVNVNSRADLPDNLSG